MICRKLRWPCTLQPMPLVVRGGHALALLLLAGCAGSGTAPGSLAPDVSGLPPVPAVSGPLELRVVYPGPQDQVDARDTTFLFGSVGTGLALLTINGQSVKVWPNGAWLAWLPLPPDSAPFFDLVATAAGDTLRYQHPLRTVPRFRLPTTPLWVDSASLSPGGPVWWPRDEYLPLSLRASEGAEVRLLLPGGAVLPLAAELGPGEVPWGILAFDRDTTNLLAPRRSERYVGAIRGQAIPVDSTGVVVEAILGADTVRLRWSLEITLLDTLPRIVELNDDSAGTGTTDSLTVGRARPGATYHWFFPTGTRAQLTGRLGEDARIRLSRQQEAWVPAADLVPLPPATPSLRATVLSLTATPAADRVVVRVPVTARVPFRVEEERGRLTLRLYNTVGDINWIRHGANDAYLREIRWSQAASDEVTITLDLQGPVWGYRARWSRNDLVLEIRRPPNVDAAAPLRGRRIVVDPGHPPLGATGPTGLRESEANLAVALELARLLEVAGAEAILTRRGPESMDLNARTRLADSVGADVLISIHNNALPDGVNPFTNNGSSVFYYHPRSLPLAQDIQAALGRHLGLRDLGAARGDLALVRPTWMPSVLCEGLFMMVPEQEAALRHPAGQRAYALAVRDGLVTFLKRVAESQGSDVP